MDVSLFLLWQTLAFVLVRFLLALYRAQCEGDEKGWQSKLDEKLHIAESLLPYCLTAEAVVLFYILFMWWQNKWRTIKLRGINDVEFLRFAICSKSKFVQNLCYTFESHNLFMEIL